MSNPSGDALMARIKELEDALRPFAKDQLYDTWDDSTSVTDLDWLLNDVTIGDLRAAKKALNADHS